MSTKHPVGPETDEEFEYTVRRHTAMKRAGLTQVALAAEWGVAQPYVSRLVNGHERSVKYEALFAKAVRQPAPALFPPRAATAPRGPTPRAVAKARVTKATGGKRSAAGRKRGA